MKDYIVIGPVPCNEDCAQVGQDGYQEQAVEECTRFIDLSIFCAKHSAMSRKERDWPSSGSSMILDPTAR